MTIARSSIVLVGSDPFCRDLLLPELRSRGYRVRGVCRESEIPQALGDPPELVIVGCGRADPWKDMQLGQHVRELDASLAIMVLAVESSEELAIAALRIGAKEYLKPPFRSELVLQAVLRCLADPKIAKIQQELWAKTETPIIGESTAIQQLRRYLLKLASTDVNVLLTGETGTGKELAAEMIHRNSSRRRHPMVRINCAAIPDTLLESELFGHEKGAFTGAYAIREGKLSYATGGTVLLDEIGDMSLPAQARILRAIESRQIERVGGNDPIRLDVRIVAATSHDLEKMVSENRFRSDLFYRLNVVRVQMPRLRDRMEDLDCLFSYYFRELGAKFGKQLQGFSSDVLESLSKYAWPGNVRELKNLVESVLVTCNAPQASVEDLPEGFQKLLGARAPALQCEKSKILSALTSCEWNKSKAADQLHWSRMTLYRKMKIHNIGCNESVGSVTQQ